MHLVSVHGMASEGVAHRHVSLSMRFNCHCDSSITMSRFRKVVSETVMETSWVQVQRQTVQLVDAPEHTHQVTTFAMPDWVNVIARTEDGQIVFVRQHRFGIDRDSLEIPGGLIDPGEEPLEAAL